ncbi:ribonucleoside-diphosphate reductase subunit alpha [Halobacillus karajensis]|uniref:Ribonucleoside-diphosphate reductase n=1 Tax=Halobacillus karajensis TaxID=195088 RepID=A0A024P975_9BACI|nr:ribonucleoside-diphosphate reductase subunit alpha [Halobacillus karajensis]CDQ21566.1 Ribonucleoside-diphosphate reductase subunit alpha 2 [Halobacillus karajensis]CDQ25500.1 Ribonucleoside-diphosphate reductase subunit alpha 2 [Halobacillus karajensis]CDQ28969.1 Ribonucleoside-diphosphate reductase subunit alpha 2 [Halobacillus karajensis]
MQTMTTHTIWQETLQQWKSDFPHLDMDRLIGKIPTLQDNSDALILECLAEIDETEPDWTYIASRIHLHQMYEEAAENRQTEAPYENFHALINTLIEKEVYSQQLLTSYSKNEIDDLEEAIVPERDHFFTYIGLKTLSDRYLARSKTQAVYELPQERFMIIAMVLMAQEHQSKRLSLIKEAYWALSHLYMTVATPTLANAGKRYGQLSSCFIDTVDDSLQSIYDSNTDIANLSKHGGGIGVYLGKIRSRGSDIRGFKGVSSGILPWMKQLNNTAVSVDQLGQRQGAVAVYLDVWHKDIFPFLDSRLNNGDERQRTHDLFTGVSVPDLFMEAVENREDWYLFDPHEVRNVMGYSLEDYFDEKKGAGSFREKYNACVAHPDLSKERVPAIEIMKRIMIGQLETGTPYMFYRDEVNRMNPNSHAGMIYCSNLCTEIAQNQQPTTQDEQYVEDGKIITVKSPGDFVVCNLSSINLGRAVPAGVLKRLISIQVRMLDNVIDHNNIPVLQAQLTNQSYRGVGLGTFGWAHLLAQKKIDWESNKALEYTKEVYEAVAFYAIEASCELASEKGSYPLFEGSDWQTGEFFLKRTFDQDGTWNWKALKDKVESNGMRNGYLLAVAPNSSTSLIAGSTASIDPVFKKFYSEEKKDYKIPVTAPDLNHETYGYYPSAYDVDQHASIRQNGIRQKFIDQSISFNLYVRNDIQAKELLDLHLASWKNGLKTTYYTRSTSSQGEFDDCEVCSS